ncbi:hypothetical protein QBC43DRAFT_294699 [Cladorrhinum sp. PSN259]|nr:hypothetical protein QBC43DRAFT_294699 [Cladorrhinum sp. PSN259]
MIPEGGDQQVTSSPYAPALKSKEDGPNHILKSPTHFDTVTSSPYAPALDLKSTYYTEYIDRDTSSLYAPAPAQLLPIQNGCDKSYGTLNHLNIHVRIKQHGKKKFLKIRQEWRDRQTREKEAAAAQNGGPDQGESAQPVATDATIHLFQLPSIWYKNGSVHLPPVLYQPGSVQLNEEVPHYLTAGSYYY